MTALDTASPPQQLFPLQPLEIVTSLVYGNIRGPRLARTSQTMRQALESVTVAALAAGPTLVSFSGGRDSSAVLAVATAVARREGLPLPVPLTVIVEDSVHADENDWQELVLNHLGIRERLVLRVTDELGVLGPVATSVLRRHGLLFPPNGYMHDLMLAKCTGATLLTGGAGDELFDNSQAGHAVLALCGLVRPTRRDAARLAAGLLAPPLYRHRVTRFMPRLPWLTAAAQQRCQSAMAADQPQPHQGWSRGVRQLAKARSLVALAAGQEALAHDHGGQILHPFMTSEFLAAAAAAGGRTGLGGRSAAMHDLVGDLLPDAVLDRRSKAHFGDALWTAASLDAARQPESIEVLRADPDLSDLIDIDRLRTEWSRPRPHYLTSLLLHAAAIRRGLHLLN